MNSIEKMINELCPEGVKRVKLGEIAEVGTGSSNGNESTEDGKYPFFVRSQIIKKKDEYEFDEEAIIIPGEGGIGDIFHYVQGKYALHQRVYRIHFTKPMISVKFAYYYMQNHFKAFIMRKAVNATVTSIRKPMIVDFEIPLPPLHIQEEIVRILDKCTDLIKNIDEEIALRQKQYEYYRNQLLGEKLEGVERVKLGDVCEIKRGKRLTKKQLSESESYPVYHGGIEPIGYYEEYNREENTVMIINVGASAGTVGYCNRKFWSSDGCFCIGKNESVQPKFLYYFLSNNQLCLQSKVRTAGIPTLDNKVVEDFELQLPPLPIQEEIVRKLDKFNDLLTVLQEERALRQKQYEHYREQLLCF